MDEFKCIPCGIKRFQWDGRITLTTIMKSENFVYGDKINVWIRKVI